MIAALWGFFMADGVPTGDLVIFAFCELLAVGFACEFAATLLRGDFLLAFIAFIATLALFVTGIKWPVIKTKLKAPVAARIEKLALNPRTRIAAFLVVVGYFAMQGVLFTVHLRGDLDKYVIPRTVTGKQAEALKDYLSKREPFVVFVRVNSASDQEAMEYAAQLFNALRQTSWDVNPPNHGGPEILPDWATGIGLCIQVEDVGQPTNPDPKHPAPDVILADALRYAEIEVNGSRGSADKGKYVVSLLVGHRPMQILKHPWLLRYVQEYSRRFQEWLTR
jgi:hypothetical protein